MDEPRLITRAADLIRQYGSAEVEVFKCREWLRRAEKHLDTIRARLLAVTDDEYEVTVSLAENGSLAAAGLVETSPAAQLPTERE